MRGLGWPSSIRVVRKIATAETRLATGSLENVLWQDDRCVPSLGNSSSGRRGPNCGIVARALTLLGWQGGRRRAAHWLKTTTDARLPSGPVAPKRRQGGCRQDPTGTRSGSRDPFASQRVNDSLHGDAGRVKLDNTRGSGPVGSRLYALTQLFARARARPLGGRSNLTRGRARGPMGPKLPTPAIQTSTLEVAP